MDPKLVLSIIATVIYLGTYPFYIRDMIRGTTRPHIYTWLIWVITQGVAVAGLWQGGGGFGAWSLTIGLVLVLLVSALALKWGTKNITKSDTITFVLALVGVLFWWQLDNPVLAVVWVSFIDVAGYIPSIRKSYQEPWSENIPSWIAFIVSNFFALAALQQYNLLTVTYLIAINIANISLVTVCIFRRRTIQSA